MKKYFYVTIALFFFFNCVQAQEYYYWAYGEKYPLELYADKQYIVTKADDKESVARDLEIANSEISNLRELTFSKAIKNTYSGSSVVNSNGLYWGFVNRSLTREKTKLSEVIYAAPSFYANGKEVGLSQFFYVKLKGEHDFKVLEDFAKDNKVEIVGNDSFMPLWYVLSCDKNSEGNALEMANLFYESGYFMAAQPDLMEDMGASCPDDTLFDEQWHLNNTGQEGGTVGNDIRICQAWDITMGDDDVIVAVLDQGLEFNHPDFGNISPISFDSETGVSPATTIYGSHGVEVAGVIAATANNNLGVAGVAPNIQLMSINNSLAPTPLSRQNRAAGINFSWQNGASVINNSWSSTVVYQIIDDAIEDAVTLGRNGLGSIIIFASGNNSNNFISYPSSNVNTISVGAIGRTANRAGFSDFGTGLDVVAPGVEITTTDLNGDYTTGNGTSLAAPQVAGVAALILSVNPTLTFQEVREIIESTTDKVGGITYTSGAGEQAGLTWNNQYGYGRLNAFEAVFAAVPKLNVTINGPGYLSYCDQGNWSSSISNGNGNYTYKWYVTETGYGTVPPVTTLEGTGSTYTTYMDYHTNPPNTNSFNLNLYVTDSNGRFGRGFKAVYGGDPNESCGSNFTIYPNPASTTLNVAFTEEVDNQRKQNIKLPYQVSLYGSNSLEPLHSISSETIKNNNNEAVFDISDYAPGTYFVHLLYPEKTEKRQVKIY